MKYEYVDNSGAGMHLQFDEEGKLVVWYRITDGRGFALPKDNIIHDLVTRIKELEGENKKLNEKTQIDKITMDNFLGQIKDNVKADSLHEKLAARLEKECQPFTFTFGPETDRLYKDLATILRGKS